MNLTKLASPLLVTLAFAPAHAGSLTPLLHTSLNNFSVFSNTYATTGANSKVFGNILSGGVATTGANADVSGNILAVGAVTTGGAGSTVGGNIVSGGAATTGDGSKIGGKITSSGAATIGANSWVLGNMEVGGVATTGAYSKVGGDLLSGGAATVGANSNVTGTVKAFGAITVSASGSTGTRSQLYGTPPLAGVRTNVIAASKEVTNAQRALTNMGSGTALSTTLVTNTTLNAGVYSAANLSTTAGITLTLDGKGLANQSWIFNIADYLVTGAGTKIKLLNVGPGSNVIWNTGGYTSLGANTLFIGTILANTYISVGASALVTGLGTSCGGVFSATSYVSTGNGAQIGSPGCASAGSDEPS